MLVTCLKCKKPVFVSSAAFGADEAIVPCNACDASLLVSESGSVRLAERGESVPPPPPEDDPAAEQGAFPVQKPKVGIGSFGENESLTVGGGEWEPRPPDDLAVRAPVPPPIPEDAQAPVSTRAEAGLEEAGGQQVRTDPPLQPAPVSEEGPAAPSDPGAGQGEPAAASAVPFAAEALLDRTEPPESSTTALDATEPLATPEPVGTLDPIAAPESPVEQAAETGALHAAADADAPAAVRPVSESWTVASSPFHGPVEEVTPDVDVSGRAGTVPLDEETFRREAPRSKLPYVAAAAVTLVAAGCLWAAGVVSIPGVPVPGSFNGFFDPGEPLVAPDLESEPAVASETVPQPGALAPEPERPDTPAPDAIAAKTPEQVAQAPAAVPDDEPAEGDVGRKRGKRRRKGAGSPRHKGKDEEGGSAAATATVERGTPEPPPDRSIAAPPGAAPAAAPAAVLHYKQGNLYLREKKVALAIEELKKAVALNPTYGVAHRSLGVAYMLLGREKSAVKSYERFVAAEPSHRDADKVREIIADYYRRNP